MRGRGEAIIGTKRQSWPDTALEAGASWRRLGNVKGAKGEDPSPRPPSAIQVHFFNLGRSNWSEKSSLAKGKHHMTTFSVIAEDLVPENFSLFGQAIMRPAGVAPKRGEDWDCWVPLGRLGQGDPSVGIVTTRPTDGIIRAMEREPKTEFLLPVSGPVVQVVAPRPDVPGPQSLPEADTVRAFVIWPGQAIVMAPGTWHWAAFPFRNEEVLYFFATEIGEPAVQGAADPWVPFKDGNLVRVVPR